MTHRHQLGDIVRLKTGWTPLCVIGFDEYGNVLAKYWGFPQHWDITQAIYDRLEEFYSQRRPHDKFTK